MRNDVLGDIQNFTFLFLWPRSFDAFVDEINVSHLEHEASRFGATPSVEVGQCVPGHDHFLQSSPEVLKKSHNEAGT